MNEPFPLRCGRPLIMGVLNVTPDSFSDGGRYAAPDAACRRAAEMVAQGADLLDVGGESTRPGARPVDAATQIGRIVPVLHALRRTLPATVRISVDTRSARVAAAALAAGADLVNDVSAGRADPALFALAARTKAPLVLMHMRGEPETMQHAPAYDDVVEEVRRFLLERAALAIRAGVPEDRIVLDPGIGFGKTREHNLRLLAGLERITDCGFPVLLGTSRKRFMGSICRVDEPALLVPATVATTALGVMAGVAIFRVHDVRENRQAADTAAAIRAAAGAREPRV